MATKAVVADRFEIERLVGSGGMGSVYRAWDRAEGRTVAVKLVRGAADRSRFEREAALLEALDHPGIVHYVAHGDSADDGAYIAMEWVDGESVDARLDRTVQLPVEEAALLGERIATALGAAHAAGVVHRDLKPANILLVDGAIGRPKIVDFGIARGGSGGATELTETGELIGTPGYMPPEQMRGAAVSPASDVYALGCVLFRAISGRRAFEGATTVEVLRQAAEQEAPRLSSLVDNVPAGLDDLVARMLTRDAAARPKDGAAAAAALRQFVADRPPPSSRQAPSSRASLVASRSEPTSAGGIGRGVIVAGAVIAALATAFVVYRLTMKPVDPGRAGASASGFAGEQTPPTITRGPCTLGGVEFEWCAALPADFPTDLALVLAPLEAEAKALEPTAKLARIPWTRVFGGRIAPREAPAEVVVFGYEKADGAAAELHMTIDGGALAARRVPTTTRVASSLAPPPCTAKVLFERGAAAGLDMFAETDMRYEAEGASALWEVRAGSKTVRFDGADCRALTESVK